MDSQEFTPSVNAAASEQSGSDPDQDTAGAACIEVVVRLRDLLVREPRDESGGSDEVTPHRTAFRSS